jgi:hypothetical protein
MRAEALAPLPIRNVRAVHKTASRASRLKATLIHTCISRNEWARAKALKRGR